MGSEEVLLEDMMFVKDMRMRVKMRVLVRVFENDAEDVWRRGGDLYTDDASVCWRDDVAVQRVTSRSSLGGTRRVVHCTCQCQSRSKGV